MNTPFIPPIKVWNTKPAYRVGAGWRSVCPNCEHGVQSTEAIRSQWDETCPHCGITYIAKATNL